MNGMAAASLSSQWSRRQNAIPLPPPPKTFESSFKSPGIFVRLEIKIELYKQILVKLPSTNRREYPSNGRRDVSCGQTDGGKQTDMTELTGNFTNFSNVPKKTQNA